MGKGRTGSAMSLSKSVNKSLPLVEDFRGPRLARPLAWARRIAMAAVAVGLLLASSGLVFEHIAEARVRRQVPPPGRMVDVGGYRLHALVQGDRNDGMTVVLFSGLGGTGTGWKFIQSEVATWARVVAFDRAGIGWSDESNQPRDADHAIRGGVHPRCVTGRHLPVGVVV